MFFELDEAEVETLLRATALASGSAKLAADVAWTPKQRLKAVGDWDRFGGLAATVRAQRELAL